MEEVLSMDYLTFSESIVAMNHIKAEDAFMQLSIVSYPTLKTDARSKIESKLKKMLVKKAKPLTADQIDSLFGGLHG